MKCNNCNFENANNVQFCANCGAKIMMNNSPVMNTNKPKKRKIILFLLLALVVIIIIIMVLVSVFKKNKNATFADPFKDIDTSELISTVDSVKGTSNGVSFEDMLEKDYNDGNLTTDEYIMQLAYSIYDSSKIKSDYQSATLYLTTPDVLFQIVSEIYEELSADTLKYILDKYTLSDVVWNVELDDDSETSGMNNNINDYNMKQLVSSDSNVNKLDKVILSNNNNFLIYYTTDGLNAITDEQASQIASSLETSVNNYKNEFGLSFKYEANLDSSATPTRQAQRLLRNNNIDTKYLETAMPIFIISTNYAKSNVPAYYTSNWNKFEKSYASIYVFACKLNSNLWEDCDDTLSTTETNILKHVWTAYSTPFMVIDSSLTNINNTKAITAHELFHHYQKYICGNGKYADCKDTQYTIEMLANFASATTSNVNTNNTLLNQHAAYFVNNIGTSIDKIGGSENSKGYASFLFAENYSNVVNNGTKILFESMNQSEPQTYLYNKSNGKYDDVLISLAKRTLTLDYNGKLFIPFENGKLVYPAGYQNMDTYTTKSNKINYSSMHYYYIEPSNFDEESQLIFNTDSKELYLLLFIKEGKAYKHLYTHSLSEDFVININDFANYSEIALAVVNTGIKNTLSYNYKLVENGEETPTVTASSLNLDVDDEDNDNQLLKGLTEEEIALHSNFYCYQIDENSENVLTIIEVMLNFDDDSKIDEMYMKGTLKIKDINKGYNRIAFLLTKLIASNLLKNSGNSDFIEKKSKDEYSLVSKINDNYYEILNNNFSLTGEDKYNIIKSVEKDDFICKYE